MRWAMLRCSSWEIDKYRSIESECHWPKARMVWAGIPRNDRDVAPPARMLCVDHLDRDVSKPAACARRLTIASTRLRVMYDPSWCRNSGSFATKWVVASEYATIARTGPWGRPGPPQTPEW